MYKSENILIVPFENDDAQQLSAMMVANKARFQPYFPKTLEQNLTIKDSEAYILRKQKETKNKIELTFAIKEAATKTLAGIIILKELNPSLKQGEFAYAIDQKFEGKGFTSKAVGIFSDYAFSNLGIETIQIIVHKSNIASAKVAQKNGYHWIKTLPNEFTPENSAPLDMELYELEKKML